MTQSTWRAPEPVKPEATENWGDVLIERVLEPIASIATPALPFGLATLFVVRAFQDSMLTGVRSFAAALLPLMITTFFIVTRRKDEARRDRGQEKSERRETDARTRWLTFTGSLLLGVLLMFLVSRSFRGVPLTELMMSASFSVLVYGAVALERDARFSYYYGMLFGLLAYVIFFGVPTL